MIIKIEIERTFEISISQVILFLFQIDHHKLLRFFLQTKAFGSMDCKATSKAIKFGFSTEAFRKWVDSANEQIISFI